MFSQRALHAPAVRLALSAIGAFFCLATVGFSKPCTYAFIEESAKLEWKGYKFTEKTGVPGTFDKIDWSQNSQATSLKELAESISFTVSIPSLNSKDKGRDKTLVDKFFAATNNKESITGKVTAFDEANKTATANINLNGISRDIEFVMTQVNKTLTWTGSIKLSEQFQMAAAVKALAEACHALHIGSDGKSVTWDEVGLKIDATFFETCK